MAQENRLSQVMIIFLAVTLVSSSFTASAFSQVPPAAPGDFIDAFVSAGSGGLDIPKNLVFGPDGNLYVISFAHDKVKRYDGTTGAYIDIFVSSGSGGLDAPQGLVFGPDGNLYVTSEYTNEVIRYDGNTGSFIDIFVNGTDGSLDNPQEAIFGPDGNLYVSNYFADTVVRFDGTTGTFIDAFVSAGSGGLDRAQGLEFGPDGNLYVASENTDEILRYNGATGAFIDIFATPSGMMHSVKDLTFGPDGNLYATDNQHNHVERYDGATGAKIDRYVSGGDGILKHPQGLTFGPDDNLYVTSENTDEVLRYTGYLVVIDSPPSINIPTPSDGSSYVFGTLVNFTGTSVDSEDGPIHSTISWSSDIDGVLGIGGPQFKDVALSIGTHTITASVTDSGGNTVSDTVLVIITPPIDDPPTVSITTPDDNDSYVEGTSITFSGSATDPEDGGISNLIRWTSDDDGLIGVGGSITNSSLSVGSHVITASVTDSFGNTASQSHKIMITTNSVEPCSSFHSTMIFLDCYSTNVGWTQVSTGVTVDDPIFPDVVKFNGVPDASDRRVHKAIGTTLSDTNWLLESKVVIQSFVNPGHNIITLTEGTGDPFSANEDEIGIMYINLLGIDPQGFRIITKDGVGGIGSETISSPVVAGIGTYYLSLERNNAIEVTLDVYSDPTRTVLVGSTTEIIPSTIGNLTTLQHANYANGGPGRNLTAEIDNTVIYADIPLNSPTLSIIQPMDSFVSIDGETIEFSASAVDLEDGGLSNLISWTSNIEGLIGVGDSFSMSSLSLGTHSITATVIDSDFNTSTDSITISVGAIIEDATTLVCHFPPGNLRNHHDLMIAPNALPAHKAHGDQLGTCSDDETDKIQLLHIKEQRKEIRDKNILKEKRSELKEIKKDLSDLKKEFTGIEKQKIKNLVEEIKNVIKNLNEHPEYAKEFKQILKDELKETKLKIKQEMTTKEKAIKHKIDSKVHSLLKSDNPDRDAKKLGFDFKDGKTKIVVKLSDENQEIVNQLSSIGKVNIKNDKHVQLTIKISDLPKLNSISGIDKIRSPFSAVQFYEELSEGVYFINADLAHFAGITGEGIKAAVLDLAFTDNEKISDNVVQVKSFRQGIGYLPISGSGDEASHGTAVAEIIADVAPDIELYLYSMETDIEFIAAVDEAISQQVDVIAMSAGWPNFPTDGTSHITQKIEEAVDEGIVFVVPSGNFANKHWEGNFVDSNFNNWHEYSNSDEGLTIAVTEDRIAEEKPIISYLMWDVGMGDVADFEMVLVDPLGQIVDYSANEQKTKSDTAFEYIHHIPDTEGTYSVGILYAGDMSEVSTRPNASLEIFSVNDELEHPVTQSSVSVPADANGAIVVGAINHLDGTIEPFSSQGPTNNGRLAPHVVGPDGVTTLALGDKPFYGTSATAPYIAGIAALILQSNPEMSPEQILNVIQQNADSSNISLGEEYDYSSGYGSASAFFLIEDSEVTG